MISNEAIEDDLAHQDAFVRRYENLDLFSWILYWFYASKKRNDVIRQNIHKCVG